MLAEAEDSTPAAPALSGRSSRTGAPDSALDSEAAPAEPVEVDPNAPRRKAKTKIGNKSKKKKKLKTTSKFPEGPDGEQEHQDYCEVRMN